MASNGSMRFPVHEPSPDVRPKNVGIHAIDVYFPKRCVQQTDLEAFDKVSSGKYTIGLGQESMAFCDDREDINCFFLTVTQSLMTKYGIDPKSIGRLDVGTETIIDKAKAAKTKLMHLFAESGNTDIEGIDSKNACYGGTAGLFNAVNWVESSNWDGRYAMVVCGDIAIYAAGGARPVGGAGAVAMLIGPDAPLVLEPTHGTHMQDVYDFYKPHLLSEYPEVDGPLTQTSYPHALEICYDYFRAKEAKRLARADKGAAATNGINGSSSDPKAKTSIDSFDFIAFHSPFGKMVQKGFGRLLYNDFLTNPDAPQFESVDKSILELPREKTLTNKDIEKQFITLSKKAYASKVQPCMTTSRRLGNMYSASLYGALASLIDSVPSDELQGKRVGMYSYGSGLAATLFSLRVRGSTSEMKDAVNLSGRMDMMDKSSPEDYEAALRLREETHHLAGHSPAGKIENVWKGAHYLVQVDEKHRRSYAINA